LATSFLISQEKPKESQTIENIELDTAMYKNIEEQQREILKAINEKKVVQSSPD
jgi:hypothetical protein